MLQQVLELVVYLRIGDVLDNVQHCLYAVYVWSKSLLELLLSESLPHRTGVVCL